MKNNYFELRNLDFESGNKMAELHLRATNLSDELLASVEAECDLVADRLESGYYISLSSLTHDVESDDSGEAARQDCIVRMGTVMDDWFYRNISDDDLSAIIKGLNLGSKFSGVVQRYVLPSGKTENALGLRSCWNTKNGKNENYKIKVASGLEWEPQADLVAE